MARRTSAHCQVIPISQDSIICEILFLPSLFQSDLEEYTLISLHKFCTDCLQRMGSRILYLFEICRCVETVVFVD